MLSAVLLQDRLPVSARAGAICLVNEGIEEVVDQAQRIRKPGRHLNSTQQCLGSVGEDRRLVVAASTFLSSCLLYTSDAADE